MAVASREKATRHILHSGGARSFFGAIHFRMPPFVKYETQVPPLSGTPLYRAVSSGCTRHRPGVTPVWVRDYVNRKLSEVPEYRGHVAAVTLHLWRGAYQIHHVEVVKTTGHVPAPFFPRR